jgi:hypothetical protein
MNMLLPYGVKKKFAFYPRCRQRDTTVLKTMERNNKATQNNQNQIMNRRGFSGLNLENVHNLEQY